MKKTLTTPQVNKLAMTQKRLNKLRISKMSEQWNNIDGNSLLFHPYLMVKLNTTLEPTEKLKVETLANLDHYQSAKQLLDKQYQPTCQLDVKETLDFIREYRKNKKKPTSTDIGDNVSYKIFMFVDNHIRQDFTDGKVAHFNINILYVLIDLLNTLKVDTVQVTVGGPREPLHFQADGLQAWMPTLLIKNTVNDKSKK